MALRIVILGPAHPFRGGGITTFNERLARALQSAGHEVEIVNFTVQYPSLLFPGKSQTTEDPAPADLTITRRLHSMSPLSWLRTGRYIKNLKPDLVLVRFWLPLIGPAFGTVLRLVLQNRYSKIIAVTDNVIPHEKRLGDKPFTRYFLNPCHAFITMSKQVKADLETLVDNKPIVQLQHPLYDNFGEGMSRAAARQHLHIDENEKLILFFGFIRAYKGLDLLLRAMPEVNANIKLLIAGEFYEDRRKYDELINSLQIKNRLYFATDFIPNDEVKYYFSAADVIVQPYKHATQSGVTPLAYHFNKPMVVTRVGGLPDYVTDGETGLLADPEPGSLASAINRFFAMDQERFLTAIQTKKRSLSWEHFVQQLEELYSSLKINHQ